MFVKAPIAIPCPSPKAHPCLLLLFQGNIVVLVHSNEDSEDEENELVVNSLCHHSDLILWAEGLATGFCKDVHGQVRHRCPCPLQHCSPGIVGDSPGCSGVKG